MASRNTEALERRFRQTKCWFVHNATRASAEEQLRNTGNVGAFMVRPSSKPNCFALSHLAEENVVGHALIFVLPDGFQLERRLDVHDTIDGLLHSLEPNVNLEYSNFNEDMKRVRKAPDTSTATKRDLLVHDLGNTFPELSPEVIGRALDEARLNVDAATDILLAGGSHTTRGSGTTVPGDFVTERSFGGGDDDDDDYNNVDGHEYGDVGNARAVSPQQLQAPLNNGGMARGGRGGGGGGGGGGPMRRGRGGRGMRRGGRGGGRGRGGGGGPFSRSTGNAAAASSAASNSLVLSSAGPPLSKSANAAEAAAAGGPVSPPRRKGSDAPTPLGGAPAAASATAQAPARHGRPRSQQALLSRDDVLDALGGGTDVEIHVDEPTLPSSPSRASMRAADADLLFKEENGEVLVKAGTLTKLVQRATFEEFADPHFLQEFLLTYRSFTTSDELLELLMERYNLPVPSELNRETDAQTYEQWKAKHLVPIRLRVVNFLRTWLREHWIDFEHNAALQERLREHIDVSIAASNQKLADTLKKTLQAKQAGGNDKEKAVVFSESAPPVLAPLDHCVGAEFSVLNYSALEVARQLTLIEYQLYKQVRPWEFLGQAWTKADKETRAPNVCAFVRRFNAVSGWVGTQLCAARDVRTRVRLMKRFIEIASHCRDLNNLNCVAEVVSGLNSSAVHRLRHTWNALPARSRAHFDELATIMDTKNSYRNFRDYLHTCKPPCIPYLGVYLTDLTFINDGNKDKVAAPDTGRELINFDKCRKVARVINEISTYQNTPYNLTAIDVLQRAVHELPVDTEDERYKRSLEVEPRGSHQRAEEALEAGEAALDALPSELRALAQPFPDRARAEIVVGTSEERFAAIAGNSALARTAEAELPHARVEYHAKAGVRVLEAELTLDDEYVESTASMRSSSVGGGQSTAAHSILQVTAPTADDRRVAKNYILRAESPADCAAWARALVAAGAVCKDVRTAELLAERSARYEPGYGPSAPVVAGFLHMRSGGGRQWQLGGGNFLRKWFVLDQRTGVLRHGDLRVTPSSISKLLQDDVLQMTAAELASKCNFTREGWRPQMLYECRSCRTGALICLACAVQCHENHDCVLRAPTPVDRARADASRCTCFLCVRALSKERDKEIERRDSGKDSTDTKMRSFHNFSRSMKSLKKASVSALGRRKDGADDLGSSAPPQVPHGRSTTDLLSSTGGEPLPGAMPRSVSARPALTSSTADSGHGRNAPAYDELHAQQPSLSPRIPPKTGAAAAEARRLSVAHRTSRDLAHQAPAPVQPQQQPQQQQPQQPQQQPPPQQQQQQLADAAPPSSARSPTGVVLSGAQRAATRPDRVIDRVVAIEQYVANAKNELSVNVGDHAYIYKKKDTGWWLGELCSGDAAGAMGWLPCEYVHSVTQE